VLRPGRARASLFEGLGLIMNFLDYMDCPNCGTCYAFTQEGDDDIEQGIYYCTDCKSTVQVVILKKGEDESS